MSNLLLLTLSLVLIFESFAIRVTITYHSTENDKIRFTTTDISICSRYDARYLETSLNEVICECKRKSDSFFGINGESPKCRDENYGKLYGCPCTTKQCSDPLPKTSADFDKWIIPKRLCHYLESSYFSVQVWNGKDFEGTAYSKDFKVGINVWESPGNTIVTIGWKSLYPDYSPYEAKFLKFKIRCGSRYNGECLTLKGTGSRTMYIENNEGSDDNNKRNSNTNAAIVEALAVGIVVFLIVVVTFFCIYKTKNRGSREQPVSNNAEEDTSSVHYQTLAAENNTY